MNRIVRSEPEPGPQDAEAPRVRIRMLRCLDWHCDDFGLLAPIEIERPEDRQPAVWYPHGRIRCPLP